MSSWVLRSCVAIHVASVGLLALMLIAKRPLGALLQSGHLTIVAPFFLLFVCAGFGARLVRNWSTRLLWEWIFLSALLLGGWSFPYLIFPTRIGVFLGMVLVLTPFLSQVVIVRLFAFLVSAAGAAIFLAGYVPTSALWVLWGGLTIYDRWFEKNQRTLLDALTDLEKRRSLLTRLPADADVVVFASHIIPPVALMVQASSDSSAHAGALLAALLIGSWYAMMRPVQEGRAATILPWAYLWMAGAEILLEFVKRVT